MNFDGVWDQLEQTIPPEISHYHHAVHPGLGWWLKTAVPNEDTLGLLVVWDSISRAHPGLIHISDVAYDWKGQSIHNVSSIWLRESADVDVSFVNGEFSYVIYPFDEATNRWGQKLKVALTKYKNKHKENFDINNWHKLVEVAQLLKQWTTHRQAQVKRKGWKIVHNTQENSGSKDH